MEPGEDVFSKPLAKGGPFLFPSWVGPTGGGDVVDKGIEPDVDDLAFISRNGDSPAVVFARDALVEETAFDEADDFVFPSFGDDEVGVGFDVSEQLVTEGGEFEEVVFFAYLSDFVAIGAFAVDEFGFFEVGFG